MQQTATARENQLDAVLSSHPQIHVCFMNPCMHTQIHPRLTERRNLLEREVLRYGEPPSGIKEVFELCRGFERAYVTFVGVSSRGAAAFLCSAALRGHVCMGLQAATTCLLQLSSVGRWQKGRGWVGAPDNVCSPADSDHLCL